MLMKADPSCRESLQAEAEVDPMDGEQTWPTDTELLEAEGTKGSLFSGTVDLSIWFLFPLSCLAVPKAFILLNKYAFLLFIYP